MYIVPAAKGRFRHEFWYSATGHQYDELGNGHRSPSTWICRAGHVSSALLATRRRSGRNGCGACAGRIAVPGVTDIATTDPRVFAYWDHSANLLDGLRYWEQTTGRSRAAHWKCSEGHCFQLPIDYFVANPHCKRCEVSNQRRVDLTQELGHFLAWWDGVANPDLDPRDLAVWSEEVHWRCPAKQHPFSDTLANLQRRGGYCPVCVHRRLVRGVNDLQTLHADAAEEFSLAFNGGLTPDFVWPNSPTQYLWVCRAKGHLYHLSPRERTTLGIGCTKCTGRQIVQGETDFGTLRAEIAARWHTSANGSLKPADVHPGSPRQVYFTCLCDVPYRCEVRYMRTDRYCRQCTDQLRRWARTRRLVLDELSTADKSALCADRGYDDVVVR
ncbi:zinc-ribbon domain-containing protein [Microbacterium sp. Leaf179]|uniref:zinc-ribbon domain-containing protein n=1 Tax=Microbacterium sp. Leaf179 TaxID=1736288 RepID=UPI003FA5D039